MKNKMLFIFNSIRQSVVHKPIAFVLLVLVFVATTICCSLPSRTAVQDTADQYNRPANLYMSIEPTKFLQKRTEICEYILNDIPVYCGDNEFNNYFSLSQYNCNIKIKGKTIDFEYMSVTLLTLPRQGITQEDIQEKRPVIAISDEIARVNGISVGEKINIFGKDFLVRSTIMASYIGISIPYNVDVEHWYDFNTINPYNYKIEETIISGRIEGLVYKNMGEVKRDLKKFGFKFDTSIPTMTQDMILVLIMIAISMVATSSIMGYWLKCNGKKYATYKTLGCSPLMLTLTMMVETLLIALFSIGLGLIVDYAMFSTMYVGVSITGYEWLHYLILICGPLIGITIMSTIAIIRRAIVMPANTKYN